LIATLLLARNNDHKAGRLLLGLAALIFLAGAALGVYHTGVEYKLWAGPTDCTGEIANNVPLQDFLKQLETVKVIRCDEVPMRIFGLSLAAWNAIISSSMAMGATIGVLKKA
jgi:disulfide bond formation protein DsbB